MNFSVSELEHNSTGWKLRGNPVFVYGVDVTECDDEELRTNFKHRIHLTRCCGALEMEQQWAWAGNDIQQVSFPNQEQDLELCDFCLAKLNSQGFSGANEEEKSEIKSGFSFEQFISQYAAHYFNENQLQYFDDNRSLHSLVTQVAIEDTCNNCQWQPQDKEGVLFAPVENEPGLENTFCILCAEHLSEYGLFVSGDHKAQSFQQRFIDQEVSIKSWADVRQHVDACWYGLIEFFERHELDLPELYYVVECEDGTSEVAIFAWPEIHRAIFPDTAKALDYPEQWDIWSYSQVLNSLMG